MIARTALVVESLAIGMMAGSVSVPLVVLIETHRSPAHQVFIAIAVGVSAAAGRSAANQFRDSGHRPGTRTAIRPSLLVGAAVIVVLTGYAFLHNLGGAIGTAFLCGSMYAVTSSLGRDMEGWRAGTHTGVREDIDPIRRMWVLFLVGGIALVCLADASQYRHYYCSPAIRCMQLHTRALPQFPYIAAFSVYVIAGSLLMLFERWSGLAVGWAERGAPDVRMVRRWVSLFSALIVASTLLVFVLSVIVVTGAFSPFMEMTGTAAQWPVSEAGRLIGLTAGELHSHPPPPRHLIGREGGGRGAGRVHHHHPHSSGNTALLVADILAILAVAAALIFANRRRLNRLRLALVAYLGRMRRRIFRRARLQAPGQPLSPAMLRPSMRERLVHRFVSGLLSPRERVLHDYRHLLWSAGRQKFGRRRGETPGEYGHALSSAVAELGTDIDVMTDAFVEARYSQHHIGEDRAQLVAWSWKRVRESLRRVTSHRAAGG